MGNYNIKSSILRCQNCCSIRKMTINPGFPQTFVNSECRCDISNIPLKQFLEELNKGTQFKMICKNCKKDDKNPSYCSNCNHIYCSSCLRDHKNHKYILVSKVDYYCIFHQKELFCCYCNDCSVNYCKKCIQEKKHLNHSCCEFSKLIMSKNDRNYLKEKFRLAESKLDFGTQFVSAFVKKLKKEEDKKIILNAEKNNLSQNKSILELINFFIYFYDNSKYKNYNIIYNFTENINLNVNKFKFSENNISLDEAFEEILKFFKEDFIIIRGDKMNEEKERRDSKKIKTLWDIDENDIETKQTVIGTIAFDQIGLKLSENYDKNELSSYNEKMNKNNARVKLLSSITEENQREEKRKNISNKFEKVNKQDKGENIYYRPRSHAIFIPPKITTKQIEGNKQEDLIKVTDENKKKLHPIEIKQEKGEKEERFEKEKIEIQGKENQISKKEKAIQKKLKLESELKEEKKFFDEEKEENNQIKEEKMINSLKKKQNKIKEDNVIKKQNEYKYARFVGINRYKNKAGSIINKMMINGYKNLKIYNANIN